MEFNTGEVIKKTYKNKDALARSECCGCYNCIQLFSPTAIVDYIDKGNTALCPFCGMDSVIGTNMGYNVTIKFLKRLKKNIFEY